MTGPILITAGGTGGHMFPALALGRALQQPASLDLRVNPLLSNRDEVLQTLAADGIEASATPYSPLGIRLAGESAARHWGPKALTKN